jgi:threonine/homoserine/homoserine lactone efflux protein
MNSAILDVAFMRGLIAGFALAAPVGPVAMLCVRRALTRGRIQAFIAGLGAATADMIFGAIAGLGITVVNVFVEDHQTAIGIIGGIVVLTIGLATYRSPIAATNAGVNAQSLRRDVAAAFSMAITNPATMGAAAGLFAAFGPINMKATPTDAAWLVLGVFGGSALWWFLLVSTVGSMRGGILARGLSQLNRISGTVIAASGVAVLAIVILRALAS